MENILYNFGYEMTRLGTTGYDWVQNDRGRETTLGTKRLVTKT